MITNREYLKTELGKVEVRTVTCDTCRKKKVDHPDNISNWFALHVFYGNADLNGDFCSKECLTVYVNEVLPGKKV